MPYTQVILSQDPIYLQAETYSAARDRSPFLDLISEGVVGSGHFAVSWTSALTLSVAAGVAWIKGKNVAEQGMYRQYEASANSISVGAGHATLPRLDQIILRIMDQAHDSSLKSEPRIEVVPGTATSGATLDNRLGFKDLNALDENSKNYLLLADVLVPAAASSINASNVRDKRARATVGSGDAINMGNPVGAYVFCASSAAKAGYLRADGAAHSRQTYAVLFADIGTTYGAGDGSTTFNVPNVKGRCLVDLDTGQVEFDAVGEIGGAKTHVLTAAQLPSTGLGSPAGLIVDGGSLQTAWTAGGNQSPQALVGGANQPHNNLQPYLIGVCFIKT
jgi:microcystin-dependent protein